MSKSIVPGWDNTSEYQSLKSADFLADIDQLKRSIACLFELTNQIRSLMIQDSWSPSEREQLISTLIQSESIEQECSDIYLNLSTFVSCETSTDMTNEVAHKLKSQLDMLATELNNSYLPQELFLIGAPSDIYDSFISSESAAPGRFLWGEARKKKDLMLTQDEESMICQLRVTGFQAWEALYDKISGTMRIYLGDGTTKGESIGLAQAQALTKGADPVQRKLAWDGIQEAWTLHQESAAAGLNAMVGWRLDVNKRRSHTRKVDYLYYPLLGARIERETLQAMIGAVHSNVEPLRKSLVQMAQAHGKNRMDPWDLLAPSPIGVGSGKSFDEGFKLIADSFDAVSPEMCEFAMMMRKNNWIESRVLPNKAGGAYCTEFAKSRTPRVFQSYMGSTMDISTLAHELGHAYHSWVMRDLPAKQRVYPMTLAETASIFAETVLGDYMIATSKSHNEKLAVAYSDVEGAVSLLLNICARFDFEKSLYEQRANGSLSPTELSALTDQAWTKWYGDSLSANDKMFWATKMHFSISGISFYNFPYTFGYLFSLSIYARKGELGAQFMPKYVALLRDTGRMFAEDLVQKHLGEDIRTEVFWQKSLAVVGKKLSQFESLSLGQSAHV